MKKSFFSLLFLLFAGGLFAQVKFNLSFQEETRTYTLSIMPEKTYAEPANLLGSAQIVFRAGFGENFSPIITSLVDGLIWTDNSYVDYPADKPEYTYVCIALANGPTKKISLSEGKEIALFSFKNANGDCPGPVELVSNDDPQVQAVRASGYNVTQHFGVLGARGNAFSGCLNQLVECAQSTQVKSADNRKIDGIQISPIPADRRVTIQWENNVELQQRTEMVICDNHGREVYREKISNSKGEASISVDVSQWTAGPYNVRFQFDSGGQTRGWHFMVMR